ncbi:MAG: bifunctional demethylmenaquinone methyltransferase/2-methoxy-6-polyprenyl-1,4-benzoquinol methylase UbiE [Acidobacteriota bacterium]
MRDTSIHDTPINPGSRPAGATTEEAAAAHVRSLFNAIAPTYDRLNHLLSMGLDRRWWNRSARAFSDTLTRPNARVLDLCCGTGDMTEALLNLRPQQGEPITGLDFSSEMLARARHKFPTPQILWVEGDAMHLPYPDASFDLVTSAFGFRNLPNYAAGLAEIHRVLRPNGRIGILECNQPSGLRGLAYNFYLHHALPRIGGWISGERAAYAYLPASIARFPRAPQMLELITAAGFTQPAWTGYLFHAAGLYTATKQ